MNNSSSILRGQAIIRKSRTLSFKTILENFELNCVCKNLRFSRKHLPSLLTLMLEISESQKNPILFPTNFKRKLGTLFWLLAKQPRIIISGMFSHVVFEFTVDQNCKEHRLDNLSSLIWFSTRSTSFGFPWNFNSLENALSIGRNNDLGIFIYGLQQNNSKQKITNLYSFPTNGLHVVRKNVTTIADSFDFPIAEWQDTKLYAARNVIVHHGVALEINQKFLETSSFPHSSGAPFWRRPSGFWIEEDQVIGNLGVCPESKLLPNCSGKVIFLKVESSNIYHFLSESIRPLIVALENSLDFENVAIREGLPQLFYEIISRLIDRRVLIILGRNTRLQVDSLIFGVLTNLVSANENKYWQDPKNRENIASSDEIRTWIYLRDALSIHSSVKNTSYVPRNRTESRGLLNNKSIEKIVLQSGGKVLNPIGMPLDILLGELGATAIFCTTDGAAMTNMIFLPSRSIVIEISPFDHPGWKNFAMALDLQHIGLKCKPIVPGIFGKTTDTFFLWPKIFQQKLREGNLLKQDFQNEKRN